MCCASVSARNGGLAEDDLADHLVHDLLEARHVRPLLRSAEVDEAVEPREVELVADAYDLLDARHADPREPDRDARRARLHVGVRDALLRGGYGHGRYERSGAESGRPAHVARISTGDLVSLRTLGGR